jgi:diguanylate cyclase (GGDEF)-like protein
MIVAMVRCGVALVLLMAGPIAGASDFASFERLTMDDPREALRVGERLLAGATSEQRLDVLTLMGRAAGQLGDSAALAEVTLRLEGEPAPAAAVSGLLRADRLIDLGEREQALHLVLEAAPQLMDATPLLRYHAQLMLCLAYFENRRLDEAEQHCVQAEALAAGNEFRLARAEDFHSWVPYVRGDVATAIGISERALRRARAIPADGLFSAIASSLAQGYVDVGRHEEALALTRESLRLSLAGGRAGHAVEARINLARLLQAQGDTEGALAEIATALAEAQAADYRAGLDEIYEVKARIAEAAGRVDLALAAARGLADVRLRPPDRPSAAQLAELESRYRAREQALRIQALEQQRRGDQLRLAEIELRGERDRAVLRGIGIAGIAALLLATVLAWALRTQRRLAAQLQELAERDPLTGVENRRAFMQRLERIFAQGPRERRALLILDLDHFKAINDQYGHPFGDTVLLATVAAVRDELDGHCRFARLGGEEFAVLAEDHDAPAAAALAERVRAAVAAMRIAGPRGEVVLGVSIGCAPLLPGIQQPAAWLRAADAALYRAKDAGRNRVVMHHVDAVA